MTAEAVMQWPCCEHCPLMCPGFEKGHGGPCRICVPQAPEPPDEPDEFSSPVQWDELPDDVYLLGHWDGN